MAYRKCAFPLFSAPEWATECLIRALPSLTIQYIADSATIELSRDCGAEGTKRLTCNGKQDQDLIQRELMCLSERESITSDNEMSVSNDKLPFDGVEEVAPSDNMENNNIDKIANQIESAMDRDGDKISLDDVMMGDAPIASQEADEVKPVKSVKKFTSEKPVKNQPKQMRKVKTENKEELMMGDEPSINIPPEEIPLPHVKKVINDDFKHSAEILSTEKSVLETQRTTVEVRNRRETELPIKVNTSVATTEPTIASTGSAVAHAKAAHKGISRDHFIPPMLLVHHQNSTLSPLSIDEEIAKSTLVAVSSTSQQSIQQNETLPISTQVPTTANLNESPAANSNVEVSSTVSSTTESPSTTHESTTVSATTHHQMPHEYHKTNIGLRPHAPKFGGEISYHAPSLQATEKPLNDTTQFNETNPATDASNATETSTVDNKASSIDAGSSTVKSATAIEQTTQSSANNEISTEIPHLEVAKRSNTDKHDKHQHKSEQHKNEQHKNEQHKSAQHKNQQQHKTDAQKKVNDMNSDHADFTNSELDYQNYKPNRKRILTKPETHTFIQKVFG